MVMMLSISLDCIAYGGWLYYAVEMRSLSLSLLSLSLFLLRSLFGFPLSCVCVFCSQTFISYLSFESCCLYFPFVPFDSGGAEHIELKSNKPHCIRITPAGHSAHAENESKQVTNEMT